jgi:3-dehydroquinate dehydratase
MSGEKGTGSFSILNRAALHCFRYGKETLSDITSKAAAQCQGLGLSFDHFQTNHEGVLLDRIHEAKSDGTSFIVINAGAWTHTSVALVDALAGINVPFVEVHVRGFCMGWVPLLLPSTDPICFLIVTQISNTHKREQFRHHSYLSAQAVGKCWNRELGTGWA